MHYPNTKITLIFLKKSFLLFPGLFILSCQSKISENTNIRPPNILLIVADDLGYADISAYGGDIDTPNLDALAENGLKFSNFHTAPYCAVSRSMVLTGNDNHIAGMGCQDRVTDVKGYEGRLTDRIVPVPMLLRDNGYHTFMAGKWHLGTTDAANPHQKGFTQSYALLEGAGNHYNNVGVLREPEISPYTEDGEKTDWIEGNYSTDFYSDKLIEYISQAKENNQPFFGFAAYTSPHWPLQVDEKYWKKYEGRYNGGYDSLRIARMQSLKKNGIIPDNYKLPEQHPEVMPWDSLSSEQKKIEARKMELYAGMVDNLDYNIGRIINHLKSTGQYENTLIVFMADNGAAAEDFYYHDYFGPYVQEHFNNDYENMGKPNSYVSYGRQWAEAGSAPFKYYKGYVTEGGMTAPMIISGPKLKHKGQLSNTFTTLMDLAPTFYELAEVEYPKQYNALPVAQLRGRSLLPLLQKEVQNIHDDNYVFGFEHRSQALIRKGDWKLTTIEIPFSTENFKLYNLKIDPGEQTDLKSQYPEKYEELLLEWDNYVKEVGVVIPTPKSTTYD